MADNDVSCPDFQFTDLEPREITLLTLHPGKSEDPIHCSLEAVTLEDAKGRYEALSYTWGGTTHKHEIKCIQSKKTLQSLSLNDESPYVVEWKSLFITKNLWQALLQL